MLTLALELSTTCGGVAVCDGRGQTVAGESWVESRARHQQVFHALPRLLEQAGLTWDAIDRFLIGRGPGSYSGLRVASLTARALALPSRTPVYAVSSAEALAARLMRDEPLDRWYVAGDARRGHLWYGCVEQQEDRSGPRSFHLLPVEELSASPLAGIPVATSHPDRLAAIFREQRVDAGHLREAYPQPADLVSLLDSRPDGSMNEPLLPLYLHPPV